MDKFLTFSEFKKYKYVISVNEINYTYVKELIYPTKFFNNSIYKIKEYHEDYVIADLCYLPTIVDIREEKDGIYGYHFSRSDGKNLVDKYQFFRTLKEAKINQAINIVLNLTRLVEVYQDQTNKIYT